MNPGDEEPGTPDLSSHSDSPVPAELQEGQGARLLFVRHPVRPLSPVTMVTTTKIGGIDIPIQSTPSIAPSGLFVVYRKENRKDLSEEKRNELFSRIVAARQQPKFRLMSQTIASLDDLQETYDLQLQLLNLKNNFDKYDLGDVFQIVHPELTPTGNQLGALRLDPNTNEALTDDLFSAFNKLTIEEVAESSKWYTQWPDHTNAPWFRENLALSYEYLQNHIEPALWGKIMEDMAPFRDSGSEGGPLIFLCMILNWLVMLVQSSFV